MVDPAAPTGARRSPPRVVRGRAVLFDLDGTLVDSTAVAERLFADFAARHGVSHDELVAHAQGRQTLETLRAFLPAGDDDPRAVSDALARLRRDDLHGIVEVPGAGRLLRQLRGAPTAVVTSAPRLLASRGMVAAGLPEPTVLVAAEDVARSKPHPDGYLRAAQLLDVAPTDCIVLEDAETGIRAGLAAGARVVVVGEAPVSPFDLPRAADYTDVSADIHAGWITLTVRGDPSAADGRVERRS